MKLIIHVGMHKTGSSYMQTIFMQNYDLFRQQGVLFPRVGYRDLQEIGGRLGTTSGHEEFVAAAISSKKKQAKIISLLESELASDHNVIDTVFISAENYTHPLLGDMSNRIKIMFDRSALFSDIEIVFTLREPIAWIESFYREIVTNGWGFEFRPYSKFVESNPKIISHDLVVSRYTGVFGEKSIRLISYGEDLKRFGLINIFSRLIGVEKLDVVSLTQSNPSSPDNFLEAVRLFNVRCLPGAAARNAINDLYAMKPFSGESNALTTEKEYMLLRDLVERYELFFSRKAFYFGGVEELRFNGLLSAGANDYTEVEGVYNALFRGYRDRDMSSKEVFIGVVRFYVSRLPFAFRLWIKRLWMKL